MTTVTIGSELRRWRTHRGLSQLDLAVAADVSQRHLSFVETGRSRPSAELVSHLARQLDLPLRAENDLLLAAGFAPRHPERPLDDPALAGLRTALRDLLAHHDPLPAVVVDRHYDLIDANEAATSLLATLATDLGAVAPNLVEITLADAGLGGACRNLGEVAEAMARRLDRDRLRFPDDERLARLGERCRHRATPTAADAGAPVTVPVELDTPAGAVSLFTVMAHVGAPADVTVEELAVELFYPSDPASADRLAALVGG